MDRRTKLAVVVSLLVLGLCVRGADAEMLLGALYNRSWIRRRTHANL